MAPTERMERAVRGEMMVQVSRLRPSAAASGPRPLTRVTGLPLVASNACLAPLRPALRPCSARGRALFHSWASQRPLRPAEQTSLEGRLRKVEIPVDEDLASWLPTHDADDVFGGVVREFCEPALPSSCRIMLSPSF